MERKKAKKIAIITGSVALVTAIVTMIAIFLSNTNKKIAYQSNPEIKRSMEYDQVQDGDENIPNTSYVQFDAFFIRDLDGDRICRKITWYM